MKAEVYVNQDKSLSDLQRLIKHSFLLNFLHELLMSILRSVGDPPMTIMKQSHVPAIIDGLFNSSTRLFTVVNSRAECILPSLAQGQQHIALITVQPKLCFLYSLESYSA
jgi:hypothetical protein